MWSPPIPPQAPLNVWPLNVQVIPEVVQVDQPIIEMEDESNGSGEEEADHGQVCNICYLLKIGHIIVGQEAAAAVW